MSDKEYCTHCKGPGGLPVFPYTGGTDSPYGQVAPSAPERNQAVPLGHTVTTDRPLLCERRQRTLAAIDGRIYQRRTVVIRDLPTEGIHTILDTVLDDWFDARMGHLRLDVKSIFAQHLRATKGFRNSCRYVHQAGNTFIVAKIRGLPDVLAQWTVVQYELTSDSLAILRAVITNPILAAVIKEIQVTACEPHPDLLNEDRYKHNLNKSLMRNTEYANGTPFERSCAIHVKFYEAREHFFEQQHMISNQHDLEILEAGAPNLTSLRSLRYVCYRSRQRSGFGFGDFRPSSSSLTDGVPINEEAFAWPWHYQGLSAIARVFCTFTVIDSVILQGIDIDLGKLPESERQAIQLLVGRAKFLTLECKPEENARQEGPSSEHYSKTCGALFNHLPNLQRLHLKFDMEYKFHHPGNVDGQRFSSPRFGYKGGWQSNLLRVILSDMELSSLQALSIMGVEAHAKEFVGFLKRIGSGLEQFQMTYTSIRGSQSQRAKVMTAVKEMNLVACRIGMLRKAKQEHKWMYRAGSLDVLDEQRWPCDHWPRQCEHVLQQRARYGTKLERWSKPYWDPSVRA